jgi:tripartite-type tricarboxylate transporter receptor subunit TctC
MKTIQRRELLRQAAVAALLPLTVRSAFAQQSYPARPVRLITGYAAGGATDITARLIGQWLSEHLGKTFIVESRPGAGTNLGAEAVISAPADGYTLLLVSPANAINATLYEKLNFNFIRDTTPIAGLISVPLVMLVNPSLPVKTVAEFIAYAKANPGKLNMGSGGTGVPSHVAGELFKMMAGVNLTHVPYRGEAPAVTDLIGGQVQVAFPTIVSALEHVKAGTLRALAVTSAARAPALPNIPTVADTVAGYEASSWFGISAPKNTPADIVEKLHHEIDNGLADAKLQARFAELGGTPMPMTPAEFGKHIAAETEKWGTVVKFSGAKAA